MAARTVWAQRGIIVGYKCPLIARYNAVQVGYTSNASRLNGG